MQGLERPPRWGTAAMSILVVGNCGLFGYLSLRPAPSDPDAGSVTVPVASTAVAPTPAPAATSSPAVATRTPVLAVYGDGYTAGSTLGGQGAKNWAALVAQQLGADLRVNAVSLAGYVSQGTTGQTFPQLVAAHPVPDADVIVVFGSRNDDGKSPSAVGQAAAQTFAGVRASAPHAQLVVIGPAWSNASPPADLSAVSAAVKSAATAAGATYVDPLSGGWFATPASLIASDGVSPTDAGDAYLAGLIEPVVAQALTAARSNS